MRDLVQPAWLGRRVRPLAATFVAVVLLLSSARTAQAGCGDYVVIGNPSAHAAAARPMNHTPPRSPLAPPCHGPHCHNAPSAPHRAPDAPAPAPTAGQQSAICPQPAPFDLSQPFTPAAPSPAEFRPSITLSPGDKPPPIAA